MAGISVSEPALPNVSECSMSDSELLALPANFPLTVAGRAFGLGRNKASELAQAGEFPCTVIKVGKRYRVNRSALYTALGFDPAAARATGTRLPAAWSIPRSSPPERCERGNPPCHQASVLPPTLPSSTSPAGWCAPMAASISGRASLSSPTAAPRNREKTAALPGG